MDSATSRTEPGTSACGQRDASCPPGCEGYGWTATHELLARLTAAHALLSGGPHLAGRVQALLEFSPLREYVTFGALRPGELDQAAADLTRRGYLLLDGPALYFHPRAIWRPLGDS